MLAWIRTDRETLSMLLAIALPMIVSQSTYAVMIFTDRYFMSLIGPTHVAATLGGGVAALMCVSLFMGLLSYGNALVAQALGAKQYGQCSRTVTQGVVLTFLSLPILALSAWGVYLGFDQLGHDPQQTVLEKSYFKVLILGAGFTLLKTCLASYFAGIGRTSVVMTADLLAVLLNVPLSYGLIFGVWGLPQLDIMGAALGTVLSNLFALAVFVCFYLGPKNSRVYEVAKSLKLEMPLLKRYLTFGFPSGLEMFLNIAAFNAFILLFQSYGVVQGAAAAIVLNWDILSFVPMVGLHIAVISLVGRCVGAGDYKRLNAVISSGFLLGLVYSGILALLFIVFRESLVDVFITDATGDEQIRELASWMMVGMASYVMADAVILISGGVLRGAGDTRWLMTASALVHWAMVVVAYLVIMEWQLGPKVAWLVFVGMILSLALCFTLRLVSPSWRQNAESNTELVRA
ncbi:MAG: MATE family efflux transporter [Cellvibrionaceae bacterium]